MAWHPHRWWGSSASKDEEKEIDSMFIEAL